MCCKIPDRCCTRSSSPSAFHHLGFPHAGGSPASAGCAGEAHVLEDYYSSRALRRLLLASRQPGPAEETASHFAARLWAEALKGHCQTWVKTHGEKVRLPDLEDE